METLQTKSESWGERKGILAGAAAEVMFAVLPLLVVAMVLLHKEHSTALLASPEWSFGAAILFGQSVVKFMTSLARGGKAHNRVANGPVAFVAAGVIVFGLVPSLMALNMTLQASEEKVDPARWVKIFQITDFWVAALTYLLLSVLGETLSRDQGAGESLSRR